MEKGWQIGDKRIKSDPPSYHLFDNYTHPKGLSGRRNKLKEQKTLEEWNYAGNSKYIAVILLSVRR
jgi:hypothetical protein